MGVAAARRARGLFAPEVVMAAHENLFMELEECCRRAPADARAPDRLVPSSILFEYLPDLHHIPLLILNPQQCQYSLCLTQYVDNVIRSGNF